MIIPKFLLQRLWVKNSLQRVSADSVSFRLENPFLLGHLIGVEALTLNGASVDLTTLQVGTDLQPAVAVTALNAEAPLAVAHKQVAVFQFKWEAPVPVGKLVVGLTAISKETGAMAITLEDTLATAV
ncbi:MAG: hypothetical protein NTW61_09110 [Candidatus Melainabacteria bacterium]|nr:hypothetical protein [Candidatus Melainabacteria bacterium]